MQLGSVSRYPFLSANSLQPVASYPVPLRHVLKCFCTPNALGWGRPLAWSLVPRRPPEPMLQPEAGQRVHCQQTFSQRPPVSLHHHFKFFRFCCTPWYVDIICNMYKWWCMLGAWVLLPGRGLCWSPCSAQSFSLQMLPSRGSCLVH